MSLADLMQAAGLTHGGFYSHFRSKDALVAEAIAVTLAQSGQRLERWGAASGRKRPLDAVIDNYLSVGHRNKPGIGCPLPTLGAEIARGSPAARDALTAELKGFIAGIDRIAARSGARNRQAAAMGVLSGIVGAMVLARAVSDGKRSDQILALTRRFLKAALAK